MCLVLKSDNGKVRRLRRPMFRTPSAPFLGGACGSHSYKNFRRAIRIPNMCIVLKLDNGKVVCLADEQTHRHTHDCISIYIDITVHTRKFFRNLVKLNRYNLY